MDYGKLGLTVGIEIHQELATRHKLFCNCRPKLSDREPDFTFTRRLRPSQSELGEIDPAALFEFLKGKTILYQADHETSCLVEMDEEPPGPLNQEAVDVALIFTMMAGGTPVDEIHIMRKTVVDGSNTGGFQRTCVVSLGGEIRAAGKTIHLEQVAIEEDAARKIGEEGDTIIYRLDRLGIPLIEITTAPEIHTPQEAYEAAGRIGGILRATHMIRRGLGTIRQDVNVSIRDGAIIEIKGVQDLGLLSTVVEYEAMRQAALLEIAEELRLRAVNESQINRDFVDVSGVFIDTKSKILSAAIKNGGVVLAVTLPGFAGLTGRELCPGRRLGTEMSDHAKFMGNVKGIFHTDELPGYSITDEEVENLRRIVGSSEGDAVVFVADDRDKCTAALVAVTDRARKALEGVPAETRAANPDGTTRFTRPRPGAARMYPETDVKPVQITEERLNALRARLPEMPEVKLKRFMSEYGLNEKLANQILDSEYLDLFEELSAEDHNTTLIAVTLTEELTRLRRDGVQVDALTNDAIHSAFNAVRDGLTAKESLPSMLAWLSKHPDSVARDALSSLGLEAMSLHDLESIIENVVHEKRSLVADKGMAAMGPLMGIIMGQVRGKAQPRDVQRLLQKVLKAETGTQ